MFTTSNLVIGVIVAILIGLSKTGLPGGGLLAAPLMTEIATGRGVAGTMLPVLLAADLYAIRLFRHGVRWDLLKPIAKWVAVGFAVGAAFFVVVGGAGRTLEVVIGASTLVMVAIQATRMFRNQSPAEPSVVAAAFYGSVGGFTTFVSNAAGPIMNTYLLRLGLDKAALVRTVAWFFFAVNVGKIPVYLGLQAWAPDGGSFFTRDSLLFGLAIGPGLFVGALVGKRVLAKLPDRPFVLVTLALAALGGLRLLTQ